MKNRKPTQVDSIIGLRIKEARTMRGISQVKLANSLGITFQQLQKYEKGVNRISASRLIDVARTLECRAGYFLEGVNNET